MIGDRCGCFAGAARGVRTIYIQNVEHPCQAARPDYSVRNLLEEGISATINE